MRKIVLFLLVCLPLFLHAREFDGVAAKDSLIRELARQKEDTNKVKLLNLVTRVFYDIDPDEGLKYGNQGLVLAKQLNYKAGIAASYSFLGGIFSIKDDQAEALKNMSAALSLYEELNDKKGIANCYVTIGLIEHNNARFPEALKNELAALKIYEEIGNKRGISLCYANIGNIYQDEGNNSEALKNFQVAMKLSEELGDEGSVALTMSSMGAVYALEKNIPEALKYYLKSQEIFEKIGDKYRIGSSYLNAGNLFCEQNNYDKALKSYSASLKIMEELGIKYDIALALGAIGDVYYMQKKYREAEKYTLRALAIAKESGTLRLIKDVNNHLTNIYESAGDYKRSLAAYKDFIAARDSMFSMDNTKRIVQVQMQYEFDKKESQARLEQSKKDAAQKLQLQRKNILIYSTLSGFVVFLIIATLLIRQNKLKANQQRVTLEQKQLRAQMNPHFIFNCLNSIQHFVVANDVKNANKYLSGFASLMRQTLENSKEGIITLRKELAYLENYLSLELMRFEDKFTYEMTCAEDVNIDTTEIPSMIIQPFIENAIRHGLCYLKDRHGMLKIRFYRRDGFLFCEIDDNGIGREQSQKLKINSDIVYESHGMELTQQRLALVSKSSGSEYQIDVRDKKNALGESEGTTILIKFPTNT